MKKKAVILVSGGMDSTTVVAMALRDGFDVYPLSFSYGQRHIVELEKAKKMMESFGLQNHRIVALDLKTFGGSALTDDTIKVPKYNSFNEISPGIPETYVPARNTIFLSIALAYAETIGAYDIMFGAHSQDAANYPDCKEEYIEAFEKMANLGVGYTSDEKKVRIHAPLVKLSKAEIMKIGLDLGLDYSNTISCYDPTPEGLSCGFCLSCLMRKKSSAENNIKDPTKYV